METADKEAWMDELDRAIRTADAEQLKAGSVRVLNFTTKVRIGEFSLYKDTEVAPRLNEELDKRDLDANDIVAVIQDRFKIRVLYKYEVSHG